MSDDSEQDEFEGGADDSEQEGFAEDLTDGRTRGRWKSRYPKEAKRWIFIEGGYLLFLIFLFPSLMLVALNEPYKSWLTIDITGESPFPYLVIAWLGGSLGGTIFGVKWLYHVVGHGWWHRDRHLWRFLTPHVSGAVSFSVIALITSDILQLLSDNVIQSVPGIIGVSFILGYFSDRVIGRLADITGLGRSKEPESQQSQNE